MGIGASLFLIAAGAILTFALNLHVGGVDVDVIGWILMVVGVIGLLVTMYVWGGRRRSVVRRVEEPSDLEYRERL